MRFLPCAVGAGRFVFPGSEFSGKLFDFLFSGQMYSSERGYGEGRSGVTGAGGELKTRTVTSTKPGANLAIFCHPAKNKLQIRRIRNDLVLVST